MEPEDLPGADDLWWSWVVLAALHTAVDNGACRLDTEQLVLALEDPDGGWLQMRRTHGSRAVLWGRSSVAPTSYHDPRRDVPDWALTDATDDCRPSFVAWFSHDEWDASASVADEGAVHLLRALLTVDPRLVALARAGGADAQALTAYAHGDRLEEAAAVIAAGATDPPPVWAGSVRDRLRDQVHDQMREARERDRLLMSRPPALVQWSRVNGPAVPFQHAVLAVRQGFRLAPTNTRLPDPTLQTLTNVLRTLHTEEASEDSGAWLFARVTSDGVVVSFERVFDSWPEWFATTHVSQGPTLEDLAWEMRQRKPRWRPAWASLLPA